MKRNIKKQNRRKRSRVTWTKAITRILLIIGVIGGLLPYVLSLLDKQPVESMGIAWVTEIVAVCRFDLKLDSTIIYQHGISG